MHLRVVSVCEYYCHAECVDFSVANCKDCATFMPNATPSHLIQKHHWREGNLPPNSKCAVSFSWIIDKIIF